MPQGLKLVHRDANHCVGSVHNVVLGVFRTGPSDALKVLPWWEEALADASVAGKALLVILIQTDSLQPDEESRKAFARFFERLGSKIGAALIVVEGEGFRAAMARAIVSAVLNFSARYPFARYVEGTLEKGLDSASKTFPELDRVAVRKALRELRAD